MRKVQLCPKCYRYDYKHYKAKPDSVGWMRHKLRDASWFQWRKESPDEVQKIRDFIYSLNNKNASYKTKRQSSSSRAKDKGSGNGLSGKVLSAVLVRGKRSFTCGVNGIATSIDCFLYF
jgi:hypothetical protein